jgi:hypothetical protein
MDLIKTALQGLTVSTESIKTDPAAETGEARATTPAAAAQLAIDRADKDAAPGAAEEKKGVVMTGPLGLVFTRALNIAFAKQDPATGEFTATSDTSAPVGVGAGQGEVMSMEEFATSLESQANDWLMAAAALREKQARIAASGGNIEDGEDDDSNTVPLTTSGTRSVSVTPEEVIAIFSNPDQLPKHACDFVFYTDAMAPSVHAPLGSNPYRDNKTLYLDGSGYQVSIESISIVVKTRTDKVE